MHAYLGIIQQTTQTACSTQQFGSPRDLGCNFAQVKRAALKNPNHRPHKNLHLRDPLPRTKFKNSLKPGIIKRVDWRAVPLKCEFLWKETIYLKWHCQLTIYLLKCQVARLAL
jgi:hypothetical protein